MEAVNRKLGFRPWNELRLDEQLRIKGAMILADLGHDWLHTQWWKESTNPILSVCGWECTNPSPGIEP